MILAIILLSMGMDSNKQLFVEMEIAQNVCDWVMCFWGMYSNTTIMRRATIFTPYVQANAKKLNLESGVYS